VYDESPPRLPVGAGWLKARIAQIIADTPLKPIGDDVIDIPRGTLEEADGGDFGAATRIDDIGNNDSDRRQSPFSAPRGEARRELANHPGPRVWQNDDFFRGYEAGAGGGRLRRRRVGASRDQQNETTNWWAQPYRHRCVAAERRAQLHAVVLKARDRAPSVLHS
jgi:hypothetical protein